MAGEKLPGRRHKVRLLCRRHDHLIFGDTVTPSPDRAGPRRRTGAAFAQLNRQGIVELCASRRRRRQAGELSTGVVQLCAPEPDLDGTPKTELTSEDALQLGCCSPCRDRADLVLAASEIWNAEAPNISYVASLFAQCSLPYRDPGDVPVWTRRNGDLTLLVQPG